MIIQRGVITRCPPAVTQSRPGMSLLHVCRSSNLLAHLVQEIHGDVLGVCVHFDRNGTKGSIRRDCVLQRDQQRQLPVQEQLSSTHHQEGVQTEEVTHNLSPRGSDKGGSGLDGKGGSGRRGD